MSEQQAEHSEKEVEQTAVVESVQPDNQAPQQDDGGDESAAFEAAFASTRGEQPAAAPKRDAVETVDDDKAQKAAPVDEAVANAHEALSGLNDEQMKDLLSRVPQIERNVNAQLQKITGKMGEFNRTIQEVRQLHASGRPAEQTAALKIASDMLKRTRGVFPELADAIAEDLNGIFAAPVQKQESSPAQPNQGPTPEQMAQFIDARISEATGPMQRSYETKLLTLRHPDWQSVAKTPDFQLWADTLPAEDKAQLFDSEDAMYIAEKLDAYKAFRKQRETQGIPPSREASRRRLEQAVTPTSGATQSRAPVQTEEDAFLTGFAQARGG